MKLNIKATSIKLVPEITDYLDKRMAGLEKLINQNDPTLIVDVELGQTSKHHQTGDIFRAEINLHFDGKSYRAVAERGNLNSAIDAIKDEMVNVLSKDKRRYLSFMRRSGQKIKDLIKSANPLEWKRWKK
jgi:ribosomal subunit interface protein